MFAPDNKFEDALLFSRFDRDQLLNSSSRSIYLEECEWRSAEHYVCSKIAGNSRLAEQIAAADSAEQAALLIKPWYRLKAKGWRKSRRLFMTRALYTQVQMYDDVREYLLSTGDQLLAESSQYDHYWGVGRDWRGENMFGQVWMDVRKKLMQDAKEQAPVPLDKDETGV
ncbi:N-glycosidase [Thalassocella blandensis]|nr:N-glycosidase [Thalassocella blandensis]